MEFIEPGSVYAAGLPTMVITDEDGKEQMWVQGPDGQWIESRPE